LAYKFKREGSPYYWIGWYDPKIKKKGKPICTKTKNAREADKLVDRFEDTLEEERKNSAIEIPDSKLLTRSQAFQKYVQDKINIGKPFSGLTLENYNNAFKYLDAACGDKLVYEFSKSDYDTFAQYLSAAVYRGRKLSQNTKAVYTKCVYAFFRWLKEEKYLPENPMKRIVETGKEFRIITEAELGKIRRYAMDTKFNLLIEFMIISAFRSHEALKLKYSDIEENVIRVKRKGGKYDCIVILPEMRTFLDKLPGSDDANELVFPYSYDSLHRFWERMKKMKRLRDDIVPHDLRKYCLSKMANSGVPINWVQEYAGHNDLKTTQKYYIRNDKDKMREEINKKVTILEPLAEEKDEK
jgi:integrase/recombinase XerD